MYSFEKKQVALYNKLRLAGVNKITARRISMETKIVQDGTKENPFTHGIEGVSRQFKFCKCKVCGVVHRCEPRFDYYTPVVAGEHVLDGPLQCEGCALGGKPVIDFTHKVQA